MAIQMITPPTGEEFYPTRRSRIPERLTQLAMILGERQKLLRERQRETELLSALGIEMPTEERREPTTFIGKAMQGIGDVFRAPQERTEIGKTIIEALIKEKVSPSKEETPGQRIYKGTAEWKKKDAQSTLMREFLNEQFTKAPKHPSDIFGRSKRSIITAILRGDQTYRTPEGKINTSKAFNKLGINIEDFYDWAAKNYPDLTRMAFPGRTAIKGK